MNRKERQEEHKRKEVYAAHRRQQMIQAAFMIELQELNIPEVEKLFEKYGVAVTTYSKADRENILGFVDMMMKKEQLEGEKLHPRVTAKKESSK